MNPDLAQQKYEAVRSQETGPVERVINRYFDVRDGELIVGGMPASELAARFGTPLFVYDTGVVQKKISEVKAILPARFQLFYSMKANPNLALLGLFVKSGCGLEIASAGELYQALSAGCPANRILFAGPGKTEKELKAAIAAGLHEIHVESIEEIEAIDRIAKATACVVRIAIRVNPTDSSGGAMRMAGQASAFGIDEEELDALLEEIQRFNNIAVTGVHLFMGTQVLDADTLLRQYRRAIEIARLVAETTGPLETIDFGGGWGTPYFPHETELDLAHLGAGLKEIDALIDRDPLLTNAVAILEPGRFLINEAGLYLTRVTRVKRSRGRIFVILDGGMNHHLAASGNLGQTIKRNYPIANLSKIGVAAREKVDLVGPLCTPLDTIGRSAELPVAKTGDLIAIFLSGAYARAASPLAFLSHDSPPEVAVIDGTAHLIRRCGRPADSLLDQPPLETNADRNTPGVLQGFETEIDA